MRALGTARRATQRALLWAFLPALVAFAAPAWAQAPAAGDDGGTPTLLAYWAFNTGGTNPQAWPPPINADLGAGSITHTFTVEGSNGHASFGGTTVNAQDGFPSGGSFVPQGNFNNGNHFTISVSTTGHENVAISYATQRSGTGFTTHTFAYSVDSGATFTDFATVDDIPASFETRSVSLAEVPEADDAEQLLIRVTVNGATAAGGNSRFDNLLVTGVAPSEPGSALVQVIHNAPDPAAANVDVYLTPAGGTPGAPLLPNFAFRRATAFLPVNAGAYTVRITPAGNAAVTIIEEAVEVPADATVQLIASGVADPGTFTPNPDGRDISARLIINTDARAESTVPGGVQVNAVHGAPDAPTVSVVAQEPEDLVLFDEIAYGDVTAYQDVPPGNYTLRVQTPDGSVVVGQYRLDASGLGGQTATVLASGFLSPTAQPAGARRFGLLAVFADGSTRSLSLVATIAEARALPIGTAVEIIGTVSRARGNFTYLQDDTGGIAVRQTPGRPWANDVADGTISGGTTVQLSGITSQFRGLLQINQDDLQSYTVLEDGQLPAPLLASLADIAANGEFYESRLVRVINLTTPSTGTFAAGTTYNIEDPLAPLPSPPPSAVTLRTPNAADTAVPGQPIPEGPFTFQGVVGQFTPTAQGPPDEGYQLLAIEAEDIQPQTEFLAFVQVIHNAPDPAFSAVDVYLDGVRVLDDFAFRTATPFQEVPVNATVAIAPANSESADDAIFTQAYDLAASVRYQIIASGLNTEGDAAFALLVKADARDVSLGMQETELDVDFVHGTPDAPPVDIVVLNGEPSVLFGNVSYGEIAPYVTIPAADYELGVTPAGQNETVLARFQINTAGLAGQAVTSLASGLLDPGAVGGTAEGQGFGLLLVFTDGNTLFLQPLASTSEPVAGANAFAVEGNFPNPVVTTTTLRVTLPAEAEVRVEVYDLLGRRVLTMPAATVGAGAGHAVALDASGLAAGTYLWRLSADSAGQSFSQTGRMTVVR